MALKIAFDLDGTVFDWPLEFGKLMLKLQDALADVFILTAGAGELPPYLRPEEVKRRINRYLGTEVAIKIPVVCCEEREKAAILKEMDVDIVIDDTPIEGWKGLQLIPRKTPVPPEGGGKRS